MKKSYCIILIAFLAIAKYDNNLLAQGQEAPSEPYSISNIARGNPFKVVLTRYISGDNFLRPGVKMRSSKNIKDIMPARAIKLNLTALSVGNITVGYEQDIANHLSLTFQGRYTLPQSPLSSIGQAAEGYFSSSDSTYASAPTLKGFAATIGMRYYPRHTMKGFYIEPYFRFRNNTVELPLTYYNDALMLTSTELNGRLRSGIIGLALGFHFDIKRRISLDLMLGGLQYGYSSGNLGFKSETANFFTTSDQNSINGALEDFKNSNSLDFDYKVTSDEVDIDASFAAPGIRFGSLSIGYRF
jgi:hypothetical protein